MVRKVIIAPLNWGLGHATRCIPIIRSLLDHHVQVVIASDGPALELLKQEFPNLKIRALTSYRINYRFGHPVVNMLWHSVHFAKAVFNENRELSKIISTEQPDLIISDNRFGFFSKKVCSVFLSHQLTIKTGISWINPMASWLNKILFRSFNHIWIPDFAPPNQIAPELSSIPKKSHSYLGILSRFEPQNVLSRFDLCGVLSGPEPQRTYLESILIDQMQQLPGNHILILGKTQERYEVKKNNLTIISYLTSSRLNEVLNGSRIIISRNGYSTIMDMIKIGKKAVLIPTPGQPEQEYLARELASHTNFVFQDQAKLNLLTAIQKLDSQKPPPPQGSSFDVMPFLEKLKIFSQGKD